MISKLQNITIQKGGNNYKDQPVSLFNGSLVLYFNGKEELIGAYLVTSFMNGKPKPRYKEEEDTNTRQYCSFIDLSTGCVKFSEMCSIDTTVSRILSHLNQNDFGGECALKRGDYIEVYNMCDYKFNLELIKKQF